MGPYDRYAPAERQLVTDGGVTRVRDVRLLDEPIPMHDVLPWLKEQGLVTREVIDPCDDPDCLHEHCDPAKLKGWGSTYFGVPFDRTEPR